MTHGFTAGARRYRLHSEAKLGFGPPPEFRIGPKEESAPRRGAKIKTWSGLLESGPGLCTPQFEERKKLATGPSDGFTVYGLVAPATGANVPPRAVAD